jgi:hypothetical protein
MTPPLFNWSLHAVMESRRRGIACELVEQVMRDPQQVVTLGLGREVRQSIEEAGALVRVIVDVENEPVVIVTVYRTSKVEKYWRSSP